LRDIGNPNAHSGDTDKTATNATPIQHEGSVSPRFDSKHPGHTKRSEPSSPKGEHTMPNDDIPYLLKFAPKEACIDNPMDGCLHTNAADRHHNLPNELGDPLEASLSYGMGI